MPLNRIAGAAVLAGVLLVGLLVGQGTADQAPTVGPVDIGFAQDMKVHHAQAVQMSAVVHRRTEDPELSSLALDILTTQQAQIGMMSGWLDLWEQPQRSTTRMAWMPAEHAHHMPGMATREELAQLETLPVPEMEEHFLRLMIRHHRGALPMAQHAADHAHGDDISGLAHTMAQGQGGEIELMQHLLLARGHEVEP